MLINVFLNDKPAHKHVSNSVIIPTKAVSIYHLEVQLKTVTRIGQESLLLVEVKERP